MMTRLTENKIQISFLFSSCQDRQKGDVSERVKNPPKQNRKGLFQQVIKGKTVF